MIKTRLIIAAWLLLLVPTLLLGVGAWQLLQGESERLQQSEVQASAERLAGVAGNLELAIAEVRDGIMQRLSDFPDRNLPETLSDWRTENPLVRNVFIWEAGTGLVFPDPEQPASEEEFQFTRRYLPLFSGEQAWQPPAADQPEAAPQVQTSATESILSERKALRKLARRAPAAESMADAAAAPDVQPGTGEWRSWYADNQLHLLGWFERAGTGRRIGVEIEMMALLSRLIGTLSPVYGSDETLALIDGNGSIFHQSGRYEISKESSPLVSHAIAGLPHWTLNGYTDPSAKDSGSGFLLIGGLLTASFIVSILLGGSLLLWQSIRQQRDARQKTSFVSNVSHELKTPLTTIRMYAELLDEGKIDNEEKRRIYLQTIIRESQRLGRLVNNVLNFSRIEQGKKSYQLERVDLTKLVDELLLEQGPRLVKAGLECSVERPPQPLLAHADRDAVAQILLNLLDNAVKYAARGGKLEIALCHAGVQAEILLRDEGPGIPAAHRQRIFDSFHRGDTSLTSTQPGTGLGLSIARQLARAMGGELDYRPGGGGGSCFRLQLPLEGDPT